MIRQRKPPIALTRWLRAGESRFRQFAAHRGRSVALVFLVAIVGRLALLPINSFPAPQVHDEFSYLIQMRMLATGHLWMPAIPLPDFFETFYVFVSPVYASMYFPGAAMMYVPALLLHLPYYVAPLAASGVCAALLYLIFTDILDGASGLLAVLILLSMGMFRMMSIMLMAQTPTLLLGLAMTWAVLQWRRGNKARWLVVLGLAAGWAAITRPADALCFAIVLAVVMAMDLHARPRQAPSAPRERVARGSRRRGPRSARAPSVRLRRRP